MVKAREYGKEVNQQHSATNRIELKCGSMAAVNFSSIRHALLRSLYLNETRFIQRDGVWFAGSHRLVRVAQSAMLRFAEEGLITVEASRATITPHGVDLMDAWAGRPRDLHFTEKGSV